MSLPNPDWSSHPATVVPLPIDTFKSDSSCNTKPSKTSPPGAFVDVTPVHEGAAGVISGDLDSNTLFDYNGDGNAVTVGPVPGWPTLAGWDMTTGFGTPSAPTYVSELAAS